MLKFDISFDSSADESMLAQVIQLGDRNNRTLGFLPFAGFRAAATDSRIAVAVDGESHLLGYCLFSLPGDVVRVVQLCVEQGHRGANLGRNLLDAVSARHGDRLGVVLKCRADWPADKMWPKLGFAPQAQVRGRSKDGHPLTVWWRSHGHSDLFSLIEEYRASIRAAAIDSNIFSDLHSAKIRQGTKQSAVLAPLIADEALNVVLLEGVEAELYATTDLIDRARFLNAKLHYTRASRPCAPKVAEELIGSVPKNVLSRDTSLTRDATLIAQAQANGIGLFITRDRNTIDYLRGPAADFDVSVLHPTEVATFLDVEQATFAYRPAQLEETTFTIQRLGRALTADEVARLLNRSDGERLADLRTMLARIAGRATSDVERRVLLDAESNLQAVWAEHQGPTLDVPLLRVPAGPRQATLVAQLGRLLRDAAVTCGASAVRISDPYVPASVRTVLQSGGFHGNAGDLVALTLPIIGNWAEVSSTAQAAAQTLDSDALARLLDLPENPSTTQAIEFERLWSPAKIVSQGINNFLVPIKAPFAAQLLGYPASLMSRPDDLGLSREHVYYCARAGQLKAPAHILWYVSGRHEPGVIATSTLVEVRRNTPERLHSLYARLGVWDLTDIVDAAVGGQAVALRFVDTQLLTRPVGLDRMRALAPASRRLLLRSSQPLDDDWYERIYREGTPR